MTRRNFHPKRAKSKKPTAGEDAFARNMMALFTAAATRVLRERHGWDEAAVVSFGDELVEEVMAMSHLVNALGRARAARGPQAGDTQE